MRVVLTVNYSPWSPYCGGGQWSTHHLATALAELGHDVLVVYTRAPGEHLEVPDGLPYRIAWATFVHPRSTRSAPLRPLNAISVARVVEGMIEQHGVDVVHAQGEEGALLPQLRRRFAFRLVATPRYPEYPQVAGAFRRPARAFRLLSHPKFVFLGFLLRGADAICPTSDSAAEAVSRAYGLDRERVHPVPNGVSPAFLSVQRSPHAASGPLLFFGRIEASKGADTLVDAIEHLGAHAPDVVVIGRGDLQTSLSRRAHDRSLRIRFESWLPTEALATRIAAASLVVLPSRVESFGNAMVEAMAGGAPLVSTTAGSIPEITDHGRTAVLVPPDDAPALAHAIGRVLEDRDLAERLSRDGRAWVATRYSWPATARKFLEIYAG